MNGGFWRRAVALGLWAAASLPAEEWRTLQGDRFEGRLSGVYGGIAILAEKDGSRQVALEALDDSALGRVADFVATRPPATAPWRDSTSKMAKTLRNRLQVLRDGRLATFDPGQRAEPEIYLVYFGAYWCGPCRRYSPELVKAYGRLKALAGDRFELVFASSDQDDGEQLKYVREVMMPWPVLRFSAVGAVNLIERWKGRSIPGMVALTRDGELLYSSERQGEYLGPQDVLNRFEAMTRAQLGDAPEVKRTTHRLAVLQHVRGAGGGSAPVRPYVIDMDLSRYRTLEAKELFLLLELDARGTVTEAAVEPKLPAVVEYQLIQDATTWLFLPQVEGGQARATRVKLPLRLN